MATIDTNMSLVMIDPNEPLELYDGTIIKGRLEWFLYALCCLDYGNLPTPLSRIEEWANALITNELPNMEPQSRAEEFFKAILTGDTSNLPTPQSRSEVLLDKLARGENDFTNVEKIQSRYEFLLAYLIKNGGGIGNIDYVLYKFQKEDETLYNTKERPVKSAILKGNTRVNEVLGDIYKTISLNGTTMTIKVPTKILKTNTSYWFSMHIISNTCIGGTEETNGVYISNGKPFNGWTSLVNEDGIKLKSEKTGRYFAKVTTINDLTGIDYVEFFVSSTIGTGEVEISDLFICEVEGEEDLPTYFTGMQSVKMPVLTTTGKNLFDGEFDLTITSTHAWSKNFIRVMPNTAYIFSHQGTDSVRKVDRTEYYNEKFELIGYQGIGNSVTTPNDCHYIKFRYHLMDQDLSKVENTQLEQGTVATTYEPYKSNILSTNEDVTLRGIGDVRDTLDCLTGEVTERIGEIVLDGNANEQWKIDGWWANKIDTIGFEIESPAFLSDRIICETVTVSNYNGLISKDERAIAYSVEYGVVMLRLLRTELATQDLEGLKQWLSQNPIVIQYQLATPTVKTVDLTITDQGGATIPKLKTFDKITHVNVSATDILPGVEMEVATTVGEDLSGTLYSTMEDIETKQEALKESNNAQTESINSTMMATTEIYESLL